MAATSQNRKSSFCKQSTHVQHEGEFGLPNEGEFRKFLFLRGDLGGGGEFSRGGPYPYAWTC